MAVPRNRSRERRSTSIAPGPRRTSPSTSKTTGHPPVACPTVVAQTFWVETLGCPKNAVDSDKVGASLLADGLMAADHPAKADLVVVNTCAFIEAARQESIDTVLALGDTKKDGSRLVVTGCMAERYGEELAEALPEADAVVGFDGEGSLGE